MPASPQGHPADVGLNRINQTGKKLVRHYSTDAMSTQANNDSCTTYKYDYGDYDDAAGWGTAGDSVLIGDVFPCPSDSSGVITSFVMLFSSALGSIGKPCVIYVYSSDRVTLLGKSESFINTGTVWPDAAWDTVLCPNIPYSGVFYAMIDYSIDSLPQKNYLCATCNEVNCYPENGAAIYFINGLWIWADNELGVDCSVTFLMRANVCKNPAEGVHSISPGQVSIYPNPAQIVMKIVSPFELKSVELINYLGQPVFSSYNLNQNETTIDVSAFDRGLYIVKLLTAQGVISEKINVLH